MHRSVNDTRRSVATRPKLALTTNGIGLDRLAPALREAGLDRVNVSLDTLLADRFATLTRRERLDDVLAGLHAADTVGLRPVKINSVLMRGVNDDEAADLLRFALRNGYELRFIEQMPLDAQHAWRRGEMVTADEILSQLRSAFTLEPDPRHRGAAPAETWVVSGYTTMDGDPARVGVIASVSQPFCGSCDRTRLTADGQIRNCLFGQEETDLRGLLRGVAGWQHAHRPVLRRRPGRRRGERGGADRRHARGPASSDGRRAR